MSNNTCYVLRISSEITTDLSDLELNSSMFEIIKCEVRIILERSAHYYNSIHLTGCVLNCYFFRIFQKFLSIYPSQNDMKFDSL